ncbi:MAG TPA: YfiR family protein [Candidatus Acidoferrales bacterium]|nr:YfiR family protein [Candidatus Acidoferrales bacterium]
MENVTSFSPGASAPNRGTVSSPRRRHAFLQRLRRVAVVVTIAFGAFSPEPILRAQQPKASEFQVKAAYLYNFGRFVQWPDESGTDRHESFEICVLGTDPFGQALDATLAGGTIGGKSVAAKRITKPQDVDSCRILFISSSEESHLKEDLAALDKTRVLTVSDIPRFSERGGMIGFILDGNRVRFDVNLDSAQGAGLTLSSELLKVATSVRKVSRSGGF